jgi:hypothetical protein
MSTPAEKVFSLGRTTDYFGNPIQPQVNQPIMAGLQGLGADLTMPAPDAGWASDTGGAVPSFSWQNPYAYQGWGVGAADGAGFGGKLGTYLGGNANLFGAGMNILSKGLGAYAGIKQLGLATDALSLEKKRFKTNLANQTQSYNTQMADRIAGRSYASEAERVAALSAAQLPDPNKRKGG